MKTIAYYDILHFPTGYTYYVPHLLEAFEHRDKELEKLERLQKAGWEIQSQHTTERNGLPVILIFMTRPIILDSGWRRRYADKVIFPPP